MINTSLSSTTKGQLLKSKRIPVPIRLIVDDHKELKDSAHSQQRSMGFIAMRRYLVGRDQELLSSESCITNSSISTEKGA